MNSNFPNNQIVVMTQEQIEALIHDVTQQAVTQQREELSNAVQTAKPPFQTSLNGEDRLLSRKEVADMLHVDFSTLWRWNKNGLLKSHKVNGARRVVYHLSEVLACISAQGHSQI